MGFTVGAPISHADEVFGFFRHPLSAGSYSAALELDYGQRHVGEKDVQSTRGGICRRPCGRFAQLHSSCEQAGAG
jgi:hypothetical protein